MTSRHTVASGETREYMSPLLRRSFRRPDGTVGGQTVGAAAAKLGLPALLGPPGRDRIWRMR